MGNAFERSHGRGDGGDAHPSRRGRAGKVADPSVDSDIDTKGARNAAITSAIATASTSRIVFGVANPNTAGNYVPMDGNAAGASPRQGFTASRFRRT